MGLTPARPSSLVNRQQSACPAEGAHSSRALRTGVAFSFETSRSLPDIEVLVPKVARLHAWAREHPEAFEGSTMWHWRDRERSVDRTSEVSLMTGANSGP